MRHFPNINYGTELYPDRVARRLRAVNFTSWSFAAICTTLAIANSYDPKLWKINGFSALLALLYVTIPLLHRFGPLVAPVSLTVIGFTGTFVLCAALGTDSGLQRVYLAAVALVALGFGTEHTYLSATFAALAIILVIALEVAVPNNTSLFSEAAMYANFIACMVGTSVILFTTKIYIVREAERAEARADCEYQRSESLLANILPASIAARLKSSTGSAIADKYNAASILFADMAGFTARASDMAADDLVRFLNSVFTGFDRIVESHALEKIKTTGDSYMVVSGAPTARADHAEALAELALDILDAAKSLQAPDGRDVPIRIGIATGPVVAGVVGSRKFFYDVWGDAVNVASRMESTGIPGKIQVSQEAYARLKGKFVLEARGMIDVKGKGEMLTWFLIRRGSSGA